MASRAQPTLFSEWWRTVDRLTLAALGALMLGGIVLCLAASPPVAARIGLDPFHFVNRQVLFLIPAALVLIAASFLSPREIRKVALVVFAVSLVLTALTPYFGAEIKGARRWLVILGVNIQASEFLKPAFVILIAWLFGESAKRPEMPTNSTALGLLVAVIARLVRPRPGRRHDQTRATRRPYRFRLCRRRGRIRQRAVPDPGRAVRARRDPCAGESHGQRRSVHPFRNGWARHAFRHAIRHQHGGQSAPDAGEGNDLAFYLLRRLVVDLACLRHGHARGANARTAAC